MALNSDPSVNTLNYTEQGGARTVIGGEIDIVRGGLKMEGSPVTLPQAVETALTVTANIDGTDQVGKATTLTAINNLENKVNAILAKLKAAGIIANS